MMGLYLARHLATFGMPTFAKIERPSPARWGINVDLADARKLRYGHRIGWTGR